MAELSLVLHLHVCIHELVFTLLDYCILKCWQVLTWRFLANLPTQQVFPLYATCTYIYVVIEKTALLVKQFSGTSLQGNEGNLYSMSYNISHKYETTSSGGSRKFKRGVQWGQFNRRGFTMSINYNVRLLTTTRALLLADIESDYSLVHFSVREVFGG